MSKQKQAVFVDVSRHREERRAPIDTACLPYAVPFAHMQNQRAEVGVDPVCHY